VIVHLQEHGLDPDSFMILAMLLHHDARTTASFASGLPQPGAAHVMALLDTLTERGLIVTAETQAAKEVRLTAKGRDVTLLIQCRFKRPLKPICSDVSSPPRQWRSSI